LLGVDAALAAELPTAVADVRGGCPPRSFRLAPLPAEVVEVPNCCCGGGTPRFGSGDGGDAAWLVPPVVNIEGGGGEIILERLPVCPEACDGGWPR
jgi:hypothetical protein